MSELRFWCPQCKKEFQEKNVEKREVDTMFGDGRWWFCHTCGSKLERFPKTDNRTFPEDPDFLAFELSDLLSALGEPALSSLWLCISIEAYGPNADEIHTVSDELQFIEGRDLLRIISNIDNIADGYFNAYHHAETQPWLIIRAIDSEIYEIESHDPIITQFKKDQRTNPRKKV
jgi:hypothetical protein